MRRRTTTGEHTVLGNGGRFFFLSFLIFSFSSFAVLPFVRLSPSGLVSTSGPGKDRSQSLPLTVLFFKSKGVHSWLAFYSVLLLMRFNLLGVLGSSSRRICQRHSSQTLGRKNWEFAEDNSLFIRHEKRHTAEHTKQTRNKTSHLPVYLNTPVCYDVGLN